MTTRGFASKKDPSIIIIYTQQRLKAPLGNPVLRLTILFIPQSDIFGACCCRYFQLAIPQKVAFALFRYACQISLIGDPSLRR